MRLTKKQKALMDEVTETCCMKDEAHTVFSLVKKGLVEIDKRDIPKDKQKDISAYPEYYEVRLTKQAKVQTVFIVVFISIQSEEHEFIGVYSTKKKAEKAKDEWIKKQNSSKMNWGNEKMQEWYNEAVGILEKPLL